MVYVSYVAAVAIVNLCVGLALARRAAARVEIPDYSSETALWEASPTPMLPSDTIQLDPTDALNGPPDPLEAASMPLSHVAQFELLSDFTNRPSVANDGSFAGITTDVLAHAENVQTVLESIRMRLTTAGDTLTPEVAQQLTQNVLSEATTWLSSAEQFALQLSASLKELPDSKTIHDKYERIMNEQLAQTETSMTNLSMLNRTTDFVSTETSVAPELARLVHSFDEMRTKLQALVNLAYELWSSISR